MVSLGDTLNDFADKLAGALEDMAKKPGPRDDLALAGRIPMHLVLLKTAAHVKKIHDKTEMTKKALLLEGLASLGGLGILGGSAMGLKALVDAGQRRAAKAFIESNPKDAFRAALANGSLLNADIDKMILETPRAKEIFAEAVKKHVAEGAASDQTWKLLGGGALAGALAQPVASRLLGGGGGGQQGVGGPPAIIKYQV